MNIIFLCSKSSITIKQDIYHAKPVLAFSGNKRVNNIIPKAIPERPVRKVAAAWETALQKSGIRPIRPHDPCLCHLLNPLGNGFQNQRGKRKDDPGSLQTR